MARIPNGILGEFIGTAGNVSGYMRMNKNFVRTKRRPMKGPVSDKRLAQQQKIKVCSEFTKPFSGSGFFDRWILRTIVYHLFQCKVYQCFSAKFTTENRGYENYFSPKFTSGR